MSKFVNSYKAHLFVLIAICFFLLSKDLYLLYCQSEMLERTIEERVAVEEVLQAKQAQLLIYHDPNFIMRYAINNLNLIPTEKEAETAVEFSTESE